MEVMYIVLEDKRAETPFAARDNMLDIWRKTTELGFRGFGRKNRKNPKEPRNFSTLFQNLYGGGLDEWMKKRGLL